MKISMIIAVGNQWQIGLNNALLWHIPQDMQQFKTLTSQHHIIMGRKTFESIGKALPNRVNIVLSQNTVACENVLTCSSKEEALSICEKANEEEVFIIGGAQIYELFMPFIHRVYISHINSDIVGDSYINPLDFTHWTLLEEKSFQATPHTPSWKFKYYERNQ